MPKMRKLTPSQVIRLPADPEQLIILSPREAQALQMVSCGYSNRGIAREMTITRKSAENLVLSLYQLLGLSPSDKHVHIRVRLALIARGIDPDARIDGLNAT